MNVADRLTEHARNQPDHPAIEDGERIVRYGELDGLVNDACANLQGLGIEAGDMVLVMLPDSADHLIIICALLRAGAVILSLSDRLPDVELERNIKMLPVKAMIASSGRFPLAGVPLLDLSNICCKAAGPFNAPDTSEGDPALLLQSSGTTGVPKSILRSHSQALVWIHRWMMINCWVSTDRSLNLTPMSFNTGRDVCLGILHVGATVVINHSHSLDNLVDFVRNKGITYLKLAPSHLGPLLDYPVDKPPLFPDVRAMVVSSAPTTHAQRLLARQRLTLNTFEYMGATESGPLVYATPADQDAYPDSVGRVVEGVVAEIVDGDGKPVPAGEVGLVRYRGPGLATGYLNNPEATAQAFRDGWFYPGDLAALNEEGYLFFKGRADDVINNSGAKYYPVEIETVLLAHPAVAEAAVFGIPHRRFGQVAAACVVTRAAVETQDLTEFCKQRLAGYKLPHVIMTVKEMPRNPMGKILKTKLRDVLRRGIEKRKSISKAKH